MTNELIVGISSLLFIILYGINYFITNFYAIMIKMGVIRTVKVFSVSLLVVMFIGVLVSLGAIIFGDINQLS